MQKYFLLCLITTGFFARVPLANAQSTITKENSNLEPQNQIEFSQYSSAKNLLISQDNSITVPSSARETISEIQVRFVDKNGNPTDGKTKPDMIIREFDLKPGDIYDAELAKKGLEALVTS